MAYSTSDRPGTLNLRGRGEYANTKVRTSERQISEQAEPRDYDPVRSDIWNLHMSSYKRMSDLTHNEFHSTTRDSLDQTVKERARLPLDRSHPLHVAPSFGVTDTALSRQLRQLETRVLPAHPASHNQHSMQSTYRESYGKDGLTSTEREPRCQSADKWMQFRRRKSWLFDTDQAPSQFTDDALTCPPIPKEVRACVEVAQDAGDTCRTIDKLEKQVAVLQRKLSEAHHPAEPRGDRVACPAGDEPAVSADPAEAQDDRNSNGVTSRDRCAATPVPDADPEPEPQPEQIRPTGPTQQGSNSAELSREPAEQSTESGRHSSSPENPAVRRLTGRCAPPPPEPPEVLPAPDGTLCPDRDPPPPPPPPPCARGPAPCTVLPAVPGCRPVPPPPGRYRSTYTVGYGDPEAGLQPAAPRSVREVYGGPAPAPLPRPAADAARSGDGVIRAVSTDREPPVGPATAAACQETA